MRLSTSEPQATVRPLVRMPTDRHTATGTCEFGRAGNNHIANALQENSTRVSQIFFAAGKNSARADGASPRASVCDSAPRVQHRADEVPQCQFCRSPSPAASTTACWRCKPATSNPTASISTSSSSTIRARFSTACRAGRNSTPAKCRARSSSAATPPKSCPSWRCRCSPRGCFATASSWLTGGSSPRRRISPASASACRSIPRPRRSSSAA